MSIICIQEEMLNKLCQLVDGPLNIDWTNMPQGIEVSMVNLGCTRNADDEVDGFVIWCKSVDEETGVTNFRPIRVGLDSVVTDPFTGDWELCDEPQKHMICQAIKFIYSGVENTGLRFNHSYDVEFTNSDGSLTYVTLPSASDWGPQMTAWAAALAGAYPDACEVANHWWEWRPANLPNTGAGAVPPADFAFPAARGQYIQFQACPGDVIPVRGVVVGSTNAGKIGHELVMATGESKVQYDYICVECGDEVESECDCGIPCGGTFPETPETVCTFETLIGCDDVGSADQNDWVTVTRVVTNCDGDLSVAYYVDGTDPGSLDDYPLVGAFVDCATGEPIPTPQECSLCDLLAAQEQTNSLLEELIDCLCGPCDNAKCPELVVGEPELLGDNAGTVITLPYTSATGGFEDIGTALSFPKLDCLNDDPNQLIKIRWNIDHEVPASNGHLGYNVSVTDGTTTYNEVALSHPAGTTDIGPDAAPHAGVRDDYWADFEIPYNVLVGGVVFQTSAFGTNNSEVETLHGQSFEIMTDLEAKGCCE